NRPQGIAYDGAGNLYVADTHNHIIRKVVVSSGAVTTLAGTAGANGFLDNTGALAKFDKPHAIAFHNGNLYVADTSNSVVRQIVASSGVVTTLAGTAGSRGS